MPERVRLVVVGWLAIALSGCSVLSKSDNFAAEVDIGIGGILSYVADVRLRGKVGFYRQVPEGKEGQDKENADAQNPELESDPFGLLHFL